MCDSLFELFKLCHQMDVLLSNLRCYLTACRITGMFKKFTCIVMKKELFKFYCSWSVFTFSVAVVMGATTMLISVTWRD